MIEQLLGCLGFDARTLVRRTSVAIEIDGIDEQAKSGWSVLVLGFAEAMEHIYLLTSAWETGPVPWADGVRNLFIELTKESPLQRLAGLIAVAMLASPLGREFSKPAAERTWQGKVWFVLPYDFRPPSWARVHERL